MSLSVGSLVKNGVVVGGNFTDSNNVVYGNTTVKAELDSLNQNLTMRWNPSTKMIQVCDGGTWYDKEYFDPNWNGYIFNLGVWDNNYPNLWTKASSGQYLAERCYKTDNPTNFELRTTNAGGALTWCCTEFGLDDAIEVTKPCHLHIEFSTWTNTSGGGQGGVVLGIKTSNNTTAGSKDHLTDEIVSYSVLGNSSKDIDLTPYLGRTIYLGAVVSALGSNTAYATTMTVTKIQMVFD